MTSSTLTRKEATWLACKDKTCCYTAVVMVSGRDIWRIARALGADPAAFCVYFSSPQARPDAFALDDAGPQYRLALAKQAEWVQPTPPPCMFLLRLRQGQHRCGLGALRPQVCRTFPAELVAGLVTVRPDRGCTCRAWALPDMDLAEETALLAARQADYAEYCAVIARWNAQVAAAGADADFDFADFCAFLLTSYDHLDDA